MTQLLTEIKYITVTHSIEFRYMINPDFWGQTFSDRVLLHQPEVGESYPYIVVECYHHQFQFRRLS